MISVIRIYILYLHAVLIKQARLPAADRERSPRSSPLSWLSLTLAFFVDSVHQAFLLIEEKKQKCLSLTRHVLGSSFTDVETLQRLSGKYMSFALPVPGARLFIDEINIAIGNAHHSSRSIFVSGSLKDEIQHWLFLESWTGHLDAKNSIIKLNYVLMLLP